MPRVLLEAAAMGRLLIGADVPGCRQIVREDETGFLAEARSGASLAERMIDLIRLAPVERKRMATKARQIVEAEFSEELVNRAYLSALSSIAPVSAAEHAGR